MEFYVPKWVEMLPPDHYLKENLLNGIRDLMGKMRYVKDAAREHLPFSSEYVKNMTPEKISLSNGRVQVRVDMDEKWYYEILKIGRAHV